MMSLFEMMKNAQSGEAISAMARQFGLSERQVEEAMAALMPAFSTGLRRNVSGPMDMANFLQALATGNHARYFEDMQRAFTPSGIEEGNGVLSHLFGSKEVSRAVAQHAAAVTGISEIVLKQMLPALATIIMGGLYKQSTGQIGGGASGNPFSDFFSEMLKAGTAGNPARQAENRQAAQDNPFGKMFESMFGGAAARPQAQSGFDPFADNPFARMFRDAMGGGRAEAEPEREPERPASGRSANPYDELFGTMFESGREIQKDYQKQVESIFDQYLKGMDGRK